MVSILVFLILLQFTMIGCGGLSRSAIVQKPSTAVPLAILVEREIAGEILGQRLSNPAGVAIDRQGRIVVVDAGNHRIIKFSREFAPLAEVGGAGREAGEFDRPRFITIDNDLHLLVSDGGNQRVARFDARLNYVNELRFSDDADPLKFGEPSGLAVTEYGETWVADRDNNRLALFDNIGRFDRFVGDFGYPGGQLDSPEKIVFDPGGKFIVCDGGNARLVVYDSYGNFSREIGYETLSYPVSVVVTTAGYWILDGDAGAVTFVSIEGVRQLQMGPLISGTSRPLNKPTDMALLPDGRLVLSDTGNNRILILTVISEP